jgi:mono/diheme cytochrome c family protein
MRRFVLITTLVLAACLQGAASLLPPQPPPGRTDIEKRGRHLLQIAGGCGCHGPNFAGWRQGGQDSFPRAAPFGERFVTPDGDVPAPNITPDVDTGIGRWTDAQIALAITDGVDPSGARLNPIMPYRSYAGMTRDDVDAIVAYLHCLQPVRNVVPESTAKTTPDTAPAEPSTDVRPVAGVDLGRYLVRHVSSCADCHGEDLAGKAMKTDGESIVTPNLTPSVNGLAWWTRSDIARYLRTGTRPDGGLAQGPMAGLIVSSFSHYTAAEASAVAAYLKSMPADKKIGPTLSDRPPRRQMVAYGLRIAGQRRLRRP